MYRVSCITWRCLLCLLLTHKLQHSQPLLHVNLLISKNDLDACFSENMRLYFQNIFTKTCIKSFCAYISWTDLTSCAVVYKSMQPTLPDSLRHRLLGLPFSSIDTLSYLNDLVSTYTSDGSGQDGPCRRSNKIMKLKQHNKAALSFEIKRNRVYFPIITSSLPFHESVEKITLVFSLSLQNFL